MTHRRYMGQTVSSRVSFVVLEAVCVDEPLSNVDDATLWGSGGGDFMREFTWLHGGHGGYCAEGSIHIERLSPSECENRPICRSIISLVRKEH